MRRIVSLFFLSAMLLLSGCDRSEPTTENPLILSTIKPIHSLVLAITAGTSLKTQQLLPDNASPHHYSMRPSDASALTQASTIIRIDAQFEAQLDKALHNLKPTQQVLTLSQVPNVKVLSTRVLSTDVVEQQDTEDHVDHEHGSQDLHIWLDADNGIAIAQAIQTTLSTQYPQYAETFKANTTDLIQAIQQADQAAKTQLSTYKNQGYITFHDAWQYFDKRYGVELVGTISTGLGQQVSAKHLQALYQTIKAKQVKCLLYEPQFSQNALASMAQELKLTTITLDDLGSRLPLDTHTYPNLLKQAADQLARCLQP